MAATPPGPIVVDVGALAADAVTIDVLAQLQLVARRLGCQVQLRNPSDELQRLIAFAGLTEVLGLEPGG